MFKLELEYKDEILFARLKGILDRKASYKINNYLNPVIKKHEIKNLVYNVFTKHKIMCKRNEVR